MEGVRREGVGSCQDQAVLGLHLLIPASGSAEAGKVRSSWGMELPLSPSSGGRESLLSPVMKGMVATARAERTQSSLGKESACWKV